jgi:hypothetical protein
LGNDILLCHRQRALNETDLDNTAGDRLARRLFAVGRTSERTKLIERTSHAMTALIEDMRVDHRRAHITMTE